MRKIRLASERGHAQHSWLKSWHTFSFADYYDPQHMGFRALRVINEDIIQPASGFGTHPHRDMEIITYILSGTLTHQDNMGNQGTIQPGEIQYMSAGTGVRHSEYNHSDKELVHLLQIWIEPNVAGLSPRYGQRRFNPEELTNKWLLLASSSGEQESIEIRQDTKLFATLLEDRETLNYDCAPQRHLWLQVARGSLELDDGTTLQTGDGLAVSDETNLKVTGRKMAECLLFDLN